MEIRLYLLGSEMQPSLEDAASLALKSFLVVTPYASKRIMNLRHIITYSLLAIAPLHAETPEMKAPIDLRCDGAARQLASSATPELTWKLISAQRGISPKSWQVMVASTVALLEAETPDLWDSGKISATEISGVIYAGKALGAGTVCHWKVRWWADAEDPSAWSDASTWEVAPQKPADWQGAKWMNDGRENPTKDEDFYKEDRAPLMRKEFNIDKPILRARLHIAGLGLCAPTLNGEPLQDHVFDPPWTNFDKRIHFRTHDLTAQLKQGGNCLGISLGNGWYNPLPLRMWGHRNIRESIPTGRPRAIAYLAIDHPDGSSTIVKSGDDWKTAPGPILRNSIYLGEEVDARLDPNGWDIAGFDATSWKPVRLTEDTLEPLQALRMQPVRKQEPLLAEAITTPSTGVYIVDFGQNFTGIPEIKINSAAGTKITFRFGELLLEDGTLNTLTSTAGQIKGTLDGPDGTKIPKGGAGAPEFALQQDTYIARGSGEEIYRPSFTFHGFRYMEVTGLPKAPATSDFRAFPLRTDVPSAGSFSSSDEDLNKIQAMCRRTFMANIMTVQSDCPHRERFGYGGDIVATNEAYMMNFDMAGFYEKTVRDWGDAVRPDGRLTDTAPFVGIDYCGVGWAMVHPLLLERLHQHYGAQSLLEEQVPAAMKWIEVEAAARENGLVVKGLGDHEALSKSKGPEFLTPMFIDAARRVARLARIIGRSEDAARYDAMADESTKAWAAAFLDKDSGKIATGNQSTQCFALGFGAAPEEARKAVFDHLVKDLTAPEDSPRLTTGIYGTQILLEELSKGGRSDLALALADRKTFPSWNWMLENGATTLWEHWEKEENTYSHNHPMFGSVSTWFFRWLGGIQCAEDAVGFNKIAIRPQVINGLSWVKSSHHSVRGPITSNWSDINGERVFEIEIPIGATAIVELPARAGKTLNEGGKPLSDHPEIKLLDGDANTQRMELGSGKYRFTTKK